MVNIVVRLKDKKGKGLNDNEKVIKSNFERDNAIPKVIGYMQVSKEKQEEGRKRIEKIIKAREISRKSND